MSPEPKTHERTKLWEIKSRKYVCIFQTPPPHDCLGLLSTDPSHCCSSTCTSYPWPGWQSVMLSDNNAKCLYDYGLAGCRGQTCDVCTDSRRRIPRWERSGETVLWDGISALIIHTLDSISASIIHMWVHCILRKICIFIVYTVTVQHFIKFDVTELSMQVVPIRLVGDLRTQNTSDLFYHRGQCCASEGFTSFSGGWIRYNQTELLLIITKWKHYPIRLIFFQRCSQSEGQNGRNTNERNTVWI